MHLNVFMPWRRGDAPQGRVASCCCAGWGRRGPRLRFGASCRAHPWCCSCVLFFYVCWPYGAQDYAARLAEREKMPAELFLLLDPLVGISTAIASRMWIAALAWAGGMLALCLFVPRGFCGYLCPLGTLIDCSDAAIGQDRENLAHQHAAGGCT